MELRKKLYFGCACIRSYWGKLTPESCNGLILVEDYLDGKKSLEDVEEFLKKMPATPFRKPIFDLIVYYLLRMINREKDVYNTLNSVMSSLLIDDVYSAISKTIKLVKLIENDIFYEFPKPILTPDIVNLARTIYDTQDYSLMAILGDALEETGYSEVAHTRLKHYNKHGLPIDSHFKGCGLIDVILKGK
jgi:hypothetical protein